MAAFGLLALVVVVAAVAVVSVAVVRARRAAGPVQGATLRGLGVPSDPGAQLLVTRWRDRAARWRTLGGAPVAVGVVALSIAVRGEVRIGIGGAPLWSDPLLMGLLGAFAGAIASELHHLRRRSSGPRTASLEPRELASFLAPRARGRLVVLLAVAVVAVGVHLLVPAVGGVPLPGLLAGVVGAAVVVVQHAIVHRPRPGLPDAVAAADDAARQLAIRSVDAAGAGAVLLLVLWQLSLTVDVAIGPEPGLSQVLLGLLYLAGAGVALRWWWRSRPAKLLAGAAAVEQEPEAVR